MRAVHHIGSHQPQNQGKDLAPEKKNADKRKIGENNKGKKTLLEK